MGCFSLGQFWNSAILIDIHVAHLKKTVFVQLIMKFRKGPGMGDGVRNHSSALLAPSPSVYCLIRAKESYA